MTVQRKLFCVENIIYHNKGVTLGPVSFLVFADLSLSLSLAPEEQVVTIRRVTESLHMETSQSGAPHYQGQAEARQERQ